MIDALYPAGDSTPRVVVGDTQLTNCPESHPMGQTESDQMISDYL
jgi:hypothetical protein